MRAVEAVISDWNLEIFLRESLEFASRHRDEREESRTMLFIAHLFTDSSFTHSSAKLLLSIG